MLVSCFLKLGHSFLLPAGEIGANTGSCVPDPMDPICFACSLRKGKTWQ